MYKLINKLEKKQKNVVKSYINNQKIRSQFLDKRQVIIRRSIKMSYFSKQNKDSSMNLPVSNHIDKLSQLIGQMNYQMQIAQKDLHILRGQITQLSFVNKQSDRQLNQYLIQSISSLRNKWEGQWANQNQQINQCKKKITKVFQGQQDIDIIRQELQEKVQTIENLVGIA